jgi:hypothetical protein
MNDDKKIVCIQCDNRMNLHENDLFNLNIEVNRLQCDKINVKHMFIPFKSDNPVFDKIEVLYDFMENMKNEYDVIVNLDTIDAFINDAYKLKQLISILIKSDKYGMFSRDPNNHEVPKNLYNEYNHNENKAQTFINAGSFIIKNDEETRRFISDVIQYSKINTKFIKKWPYDQYYLSKYVFNNKDKFYILKCDVLNSPYGSILRHNWKKNAKLKNDMTTILREKVNLDELISTAPYINTSVFLV